MKKFLTIIILLLLFFSTGCVTSVAPISSSAGTFVPITESPASTVSSLTITPARTPIPPTLTPLALLQFPVEIKAKLFWLLRDENCRLPCLLGITLGTTTRQEMRNFLDQFAPWNTDELSASIQKEESRGGASFYFRASDNLYISMGTQASYHYYGDLIETISFLSFSQLELGDGTQLKWDSKYADWMEYYLLPQILTNHGKPSQVLILTFPDDPQHPDIHLNSLYLALFYPDQGFLLEYHMKRETVEGKFVGCPAESFVSIGTWSPGNDEGYKKISGILHGYLSDYKPIADATSMSLDEFYVTYKEQTTNCIETPIEVWLHQ